MRFWGFLGWVLGIFFIVWCFSALRLAFFDNYEYSSTAGKVGRIIGFISVILLICFVVIFLI